MGIVAIDVGHGFCKGLGPRGGRWKGPSWIVPAVGENAGQDMIAVASARPVIVTWGSDSQAYWWGTDAPRQARTVLGHEKGMSTGTRDLTLLALASTVAADGMRGDAEPWTLAVGVPLGWYQAERQALQQQLHGTGSVNGIPLTISRVAVYPQGMAAALSLMTPASEPGLYGIVDVGYGTTEYVVVEWSRQGLRVTADPAGTWDIGTRNLALHVAAQVRAETGVALWPEDVDHQTQIVIRGRDVDLARYQARALRAWQATMRDYLDAAWSAVLPRMRRCWVIGGGATVLRDVVVAGMPLTVAADPQWANVLGYYAAIQAEGA
ncbi:MAG: hypothetical protein C7B47_17865 [Sulfobacillus thermosulfidooxidans]|uniref:Uncharacterized protein n=1 Tax=Sulfobacillus thermosulfidooxidans TaxID=28034 RepID=A0A2T2WEK5_SULTH|nr:MAG: hypothetical protein C7B47_17865 [Sulfobacillus thermosulfidooxidans]